MKVSIIIPVYNVEKYLSKCILSVLEQTYKKLEIFLVNDGSTDSSGKICDEFSKIDSRIKVIHKENGGQGSARNMALQECTGKYIMFLDSDDSISKDCVEFLYKLIIDNNADIAVSNYSLYNEKGNFIRKNVDGVGTLKFSGIDAIKSMWYREIINIGPWAKLYNSDLWEDIRFDECFAEDYATMHKIFIKTNNIIYSFESKLNYLVRLNSDVRKFNLNKVDMIKIAKNNIKFTDTYPELRDAAINKAISVWFHVLFQLPKNFNNKELEKEIIDNIKKYRKYTLQDKRCRKKVRYALIGSYFLGFSVVKKILLAIKKKAPSF